MDIRKLSIEERNCPYQMAKHFVTQNDNDFYERIRFLGKSYSINELKNIVHLCQLFNRNESYISKILNVSKVKEIENVELLVDKAISDLDKKLKSDKKDYYIKEIENGSKKISEDNLNKFSLSFLKEIESEFIELRNELKDKGNSSLFFDNINKMISCIQISSLHIIKNQKSLTPNMLKDKSIFTGFLMKNSILKTMKIEEEKIEELKDKPTPKNKPKRKPSLKMK